LVKLLKVFAKNWDEPIVPVKEWPYKYLEGYPFIDLGFNITNKIKIRLYGINAPEIRGEQRPEGLKSRDYLRSLILDKDIIIQTLKDKKGKYGRYIGIIHLEDKNINELLVESGHAVKKEY